MPSAQRLYEQYLGREFSSQAKKGLPYSALTPTIGVVWQTGAPHPSFGFHERFRLRGDVTGAILSDAIALHMLQLGLAPRRAPVAESETAAQYFLRVFARFLSVRSRDELDELEKEVPIMSDAANTLKTISADPEVARLALERAEAEFSTS